MRKLLAILLALTMLLCFTACDGGGEAQETTEAPVETTHAPEETIEETEAPSVSEAGFCFTLNGVVLTPGTTYDASALPEPASVYQVPSCAIEGTDNVYSFDTVEVTAFNDGTKEIIYAIAILDPNLCTDEGLYLGDSADKVLELYGEEYQENGTAMVYTKGNTKLTVIVQNGYVVDIEFSWITE